MQPSIALLSNVTIDPLKNTLLQSGFGEVYTAGYNQWHSELLSPNSEIHKHPFDYIFIYLHPDEWPGELIPDDIIGCIRSYLQQQAHGIVILCDLSGKPLDSNTFFSRRDEKKAYANKELQAFAQSEKRVRILPFSHMITHYGYKNLFDSKYWYLGRIKLSFEGFRLMALQLSQLIHALEGKNKKVLVLDLDNTLWGGIVGEEGWQNITLANEGKGLIYKDFQRQIAALMETGVVLTLCSKNNEADVRDVFANHPDMVLKWNHFVSTRVNWLSKDENIHSIAGELNLGPDSFVFIDDNVRERELVRSSIQGIIVPDFPADTTQLADWFVTEVAYPYFARTELTQEDRDKNLQYQRNAQREQAKQQISFDDYISQLNIEIKVSEATEDELTRIAQLTQKTNQFNLSLKRYTGSEIDQMYRSKNWKLYTSRYSDKFGDEGIVGAILIETDGRTANIDNFLLSCRALGRRAEFTILKQLIIELKNEGISTITAGFTPGERNMPASEFYSDFGFSTINTNQYELKL